MPAHAIPEGNIPAEPFDIARLEFEGLVTTLSAAETLSMTHSELELLLQHRGAEVMRQLLQDHLSLRGSGAVPEGRVTGADEVVRTHQRLRNRVLMTVFGVVLVARMAYGMRKHASLMPLDGALNLPDELYSHGIQRRVAEEAAKTSFDEVVATLKRTTAAKVPKRQVEQVVVKAAQDFDAFYASRSVATPEKVQATGKIMVLTADGKGVRMHRKDLREVTRQAAEQCAAQQARTRFSLGQPRPAGVARDRKRMAQVAAVYTIEPFVRSPDDVVGELQHVHLVQQQRPSPENKRVWASVKKDPGEVLGAAFDEARRRDPELAKPWVALVDGNETQRNTLLAMADVDGVKLTLILDFIHVAEYVWKAAFALHERGSKEAELWVRERLAEILRGNSSLVAGGMRRSATLRQLTAVQRKSVDECADYLLKYAAHLRYHEYLAAGFPIATGVIEGACRYLVKDRMEITGAVWCLASAEAVLQLRALRASGDFDAYWAFHENQERLRNHIKRYAYGPPCVAATLPATLPRPPKLRLVQ